MDTQHSVHRFGYSPTEAAVATGLSLSTVNRKLATGELKSVKVGRRRVISPEALERLCNPDVVPREEIGQLCRVESA